VVSIATLPQPQHSCLFADLQYLLLD